MDPDLPYDVPPPSQRIILSAVDEMIRGIGWAATTVGNVAQAAGVSRQSVYNMFGSRRSLGQAYVEYRLDVLLGAIENTIRSAEDPEEGFRAAFLQFFELVDEPLIHTVLSGRTRAEDLVPIVTLLNERATERLKVLIRELRPDLSESDAIVFGDAIARLAVAHAVVPTLERDMAVDRMVRLAVLFLHADLG